MDKKAFNKILVPLDGSKNSLRGLKFALILAKQSGSSVIGLNVFSLPIFLKTLPIVMHKKEQKSKEIIKQAKLIAKKANVSFTGMTKVSSNIGKTIVTFSKNRKVDMIIIGSRGPDPEIEMFLGSVANYVVNKSKIPVTVVK
jgi:nucleotide-binding universal stress UspA family protein